MAWSKKKTFALCCAGLMVLVGLSAVVCARRAPGWITGAMVSSWSQVPDVEARCSDANLSIWRGWLWIGSFGLFSRTGTEKTELFGWRDLTARFYPLSLLGRIIRVQSIEIRDLACNLQRRPDGTWNLAPALRALTSRGQPSPRPRGIALGTLAIRGGHLNLRDWVAEDVYARADIRSIQCVASLYHNMFDRKTTFCSFDINTIVQTSESGRLRIRGTYQKGRAVNAQMLITITGVGLRDVDPYCRNSAIRLEGGTADVEGYFRCVESQIDAQFTITVRNVKASTRPRSPQELALHIPATVGLRLLTDEIPQFPLTVTITGDLQDPQFRLEHALINAIAKTFSIRARRLAGVPLAALEAGMKTGKKIVRETVKTGAAVGGVAVDLGKSTVEKAGSGLKAAASSIEKLGGRASEVAEGANSVGKSVVKAAGKAAQTTKNVGSKAVEAGKDTGGSIGSFTRTLGRGLRHLIPFGAKTKQENSVEEKANE